MDVFGVDRLWSKRKYFENQDITTFYQLFLTFCTKCHYIFCILAGSIKSNVKNPISQVCLAKNIQLDFDIS